MGIGGKEKRNELMEGDTPGVTVIVVESELDYSISNPERICLHFIKL